MAFQPFNNLLILELGQAVAGPYIGTLLADLGAEVIHIERPGVGDLARHWIPIRADLSFYFGVVNRNKKSMTLDLKQEKGREIFFRLAEKADVIIENFVPGVVKKLGVDYEAVKKVKPDIIYCHVSGFGQDGPYRDRPAFDQLIQGEAGIISYTGTRETPCKINVPITDLLASMYGAYAVLAALLRREKTGEGMEIDISLFDCAVTMMLNLMNMAIVEGMKDEELRMGTKYFLATPYEPYPAGDGKLVNVVVATEWHWKEFCKAVGLEELLDDPRFATNQQRLKHREQLERIIIEKFREKPRDDWIEILLKAGVPCGAVNTIREVIEHPQTKHRKTVVEVDYPELGKIKLFNNPVKFSGFEVEVRRPPKLGEHTEEILEKLGYDKKEIESLREGGVI
ncbi:putative acyl-CoA transferase/carnitine dehydratase [Archaeoglobus fulgidus DSM 8774]|uniref:Putative acyl-CoA transferase/carnitine dehydratase n=2 Tax=Archaeoglobus fulgidus TaxID=2234 RepID=A0A075WDU1_ARCFL|nr:CaiB/BaiF CoA-transferase family protein [Archaeoglobus fulgidus]AIG97867.1 putative acyl-CoA transferase/carnitine dehydratase [Archaeoglobus fulgidus DSM 8774]